MTISVSPQEVTGLDLLLAAKQNKLKSSATINVLSDGTLNLIGGSSYSLPIASSTVLGGVKIGAGLSIDGSGILSATSTGGGLPSLYKIPDQAYAQEYRSSDFGVTYSDGITQGAYFTNGIEHAINLNWNERPDNVFTIAAYNHTAQGNRITNDGSWRMAVETNYDISGYPKSFEPHLWNYTNFEGTSTRALSGYFSKTVNEDGHSHGFWAMECDYLQLSLPPKKGDKPIPYAAISNALVEITASQYGRISGFRATQVIKDAGTHTLGIWDIGGVTFIEGGFVQGKGYGHNYINTPSFANDTLAKTTNEKLLNGEVYWRTITLPNGEVLDVITRVK